MKCWSITVDLAIAAPNITEKFIKNQANYQTGYQGHLDYPKFHFHRGAPDANGHAAASCCSLRFHTIDEMGSVLMAPTILGGLTGGLKME